MSNEEVVAQLKKAYEAEEYFPGVLGNPALFAARWALGDRVAPRRRKLAVRGRSVRVNPGASSRKRRANEKRK